MNVGSKATLFLFTSMHDNVHEYIWKSDCLLTYGGWEMNMKMYNASNYPCADSLFMDYYSTTIILYHMNKRLHMGSPILINGFLSPFALFNGVMDT